MLHIRIGCMLQFQFIREFSKIDLEPKGNHFDTPLSEASCILRRSMKDAKNNQSNMENRPLTHHTDAKVSGLLLYNKGRLCQNTTAHGSNNA